jgi:FtsH-binding integral membrane protein
MPFQDPSGSMHNTVADEIDRLEKMPLAQKRAFDAGLTSFMVRNQYLGEKVAFIRKTYGILALWLTLSVLISIPFLKHQTDTVEWFTAHSWILWLAGIVLFLQTSFYLLVCGFLFTGQRLLLLVYLKMLIYFPVNYFWTFLYVSSFTLLVDMALASFSLGYICYVYLYTAIAVLGLIAYTYVVRNPDFKHLYAYLVPICNAIVISLILRVAADVYNESLQHAVAILLSILFGWIVVFDTQLIFGTKVERGRKYPYQSTMYAMAAYEMYFDLFIHFYLGALNLFPAGEADDPLSAAAGN